METRATRGEATASDHLAIFAEIARNEEALALESSKPNRREDRTVQINIRCSPEQRDKIKESAATRGTDMNALILEATLAWLEKTT